MCGIVGYVGQRQAVDVLLSGLRRLEYRGYDSAGISLGQGNEPPLVIKEVGEVSNLESALTSISLPTSAIGIGHTRWATTGKPTVANAHPQISCDGRIAVVHNGIVENAADLRDELKAEGHSFRSETDTEVMAHMLEALTGAGNDLITSVRLMAERLQGYFAIAVTSVDEPDVIVGAKHESPLMIGQTPEEIFLASDHKAFRQFTDMALNIRDGEMVLAKRNGQFELLSLKDGRPIPARPFMKLSYELEDLNKGPYPYYLLKEIMEQPDKMSELCSGRFSRGRDGQPVVRLHGADQLSDFLSSPELYIYLVGCGTSYHAALMGKQIIQYLTGQRCQVEHGSEFATGDSPIDERTLVMAFSQSGETKDTNDAVRRARRHRAKIWGVVNEEFSTLGDELTDQGTYLRVGPEVSVASTKSFTGQVLAAALFALKLVELRGNPRSQADLEYIIRSMEDLPEQIAQVLTKAREVEQISYSLHQSEQEHALFIGRGFGYPVALEGALKLKEVSYIHAEGYPAGELKHGPLALVHGDELGEPLQNGVASRIRSAMPIIGIATSGPWDTITFSKMLSNIEEVSSREGKLIVIGTEGDKRVERLITGSNHGHLLTVPQTHPFFGSLLANVYCQLLAYYMAVRRGLDVDKPRHLSKANTVD